MKKILVAMSGGVDSSVTVGLLQKEGYEVSGATMRLYDHTAALPDAKSCCSVESSLDAREVCYRLGTEHYVFNCTDAFRREVIDRFIEGYRKGETPNPCLDCNRFLKFGEFLKRGRELGFDGIATGHYARIQWSEDLQRWTLLKGLDNTKDQSYALYAMTQDELAHTLLPLGNYRKSEIRTIAHELDLDVADKPDSQDICFVDGEEYGDFIIREGHETPVPGDFVTKDGTKLGRHKGQLFYTIGQRRGLGISADSRLYVIGKDADKNEVYLGSNTDLFPASIIVKELNWIAFETLKEPITAKVMTRYRSKEADAKISPLENGRVLVEFLSPQRAPTPGQAAVFYDGEMVLGGGIIEQWR